MNKISVFPNICYFVLYKPIFLSMVSKELWNSKLIIFGTERGSMLMPKAAARSAIGRKSDIT